MIRQSQATPASGARRRWAAGCAALLGLLHAPAATAWQETGHLIAAQIAWQELSPAARQRAASTLAPLGDGTFVDFSLWLDRRRARGLHHFDAWHYVNLPYVVGALPAPPGKPAAENVVWAIDQARATLENPAAGPFERAFALALLIHLVADVHQPLHCADRITPQHPQGDRGGNDFPIRHPAANLHRLWDRLADLFPPLDPQDPNAVARRLPDYVERLRQRVPKSSQPGWRQLDARGWAQESYRLGVDVAYHGIEEGAVPSPAYLERVRAIAGERLALSGYRLAHLLEQLLASP